MVQTVWNTLFHDNCFSHVHDDPLFTFHIQNEWLPHNINGTYAILKPRLLFWVQGATAVLISSILSVAIAIVIYYGIIQRRGSHFTHLLTWGFILPSGFILPQYIILYVGVLNKAVVTSLSSITVFVGLRSLEATYGFSPHSVEDSLTNYCLYYASVIEFVYDQRTRKPSPIDRRELCLQKGKGLLVNYLLISLLLSYMEAHNYQPLTNTATTGEPNTWFSKMISFIHPIHIGNNFLLALLTCFSLTIATSLFGFAISMLTGLQTLDAFDNPIFASKSVSDFWQRWNRLVQNALKRGVYKPVRKHSTSKILAALATFVASGIIHEYVLLLLALPKMAVDTDATSSESLLASSYMNYVPTYGNHFCFFAWNAMLISLEFLFLGRLLEYLNSIIMIPIPQFMRNMLVILMALPISHWFTDEYVHSGYFSHLSTGFPKIVKLSEH